MLSKREFFIKNKPKILTFVFKIKDRATDLTEIQGWRIEDTV